jgi:hypothetical protein
MFKLAYFSFLGAIASTPVHFLTNINTHWALLGLMAAAGAFLAAGMMRRP